MNSEKQLLSLINAAQVLTSTLDLDKVLDQLIKEVLQVIEGADAGVFFKYEPKVQKLIAENAIGYDMTYLGKIQLSPDEAMTGKTFTSQQARIFDSKKDTEKNMLNLYPEHVSYYEKSLGQLKYPASAICAPLLTKTGDCLGILTIVSFNEKVRFEQRDLRLLETFARQAVIAIENARMFSQTERSQNIIKKLSLVSLSGKGLPEITVTLSKLVDKNVCVFDEFFDLLSFSSLEAKTLAEALQKDESFFVKEDKVRQLPIELEGNMHEVYFFPIRANDSLIGLLTVFSDSSDELDPLDLFAVEQAHMIFALEMMNQERDMSELFKFEGYLLEKLIQQRAADISIKQLQKIGLTTRRTFVSAFIQLIDPMTSFSRLSSRKKPFSRLLYRQIQSFSHKLLVLEKNVEIHLLFIANTNCSAEEFQKDIEGFLQELLHESTKRGLLDFYAGIGSPFTSLESIVQSATDAKSCVKFLQTSREKQSIMNFKELGLYRLFLEHDRQNLRYYIEKTLGALLQHDEEHGTELVDTLKIFLECNQSVTKTAKLSYVHLNTIKYRLQTIKKILGKSTIDGKEMFELQLAIYMHDYMNSI
ncbi:GAF domain-containing protein [Bacillus sp. FJAT-42315]|uniref:GAF domain-containing protein n=1 Tax=Bacillus sp. FJAT-42315 TaxID=2014077 RepID=UPI0018E1DD21|nr:GAF domain-containing protein [Bacillus sp. FJAT-42315]